MPERHRPQEAALWAELGRWVESSLGLHYPPRLWPDLERGMEAAARRLHLPDAAAAARGALAGRLGEEARQVLTECLAVGETYFFRDPQLFDEIATQVLQPLIAARRGMSRRLRLWSAGCSSGEEPYSLAMLVASLLPEWRDWDLSILGTDLNAASLRKARGASYGPWSLRGGIPDACRAYLREGADGRHHVDSELRRRVRFEQLNLASESYPSAATMTTDMDLVLCRNVLIYFEPARGRAVLARLGRALADDGWLVTGSVEIPATAIAGLTLVRSDGLFALRHTPAVASAPAPAAPQLAPQPSPRPRPPLHAVRARPAPAPRLAPAAKAVRAALPPAAAPEAPLPATLVEQARQLADAGELAAAEQLCRQAIAQNKLDPAVTYLLATILTERGALAEAMAALQRTLYLDPEHLLARFNLGSLALRQGQRQAGRRHLSHALERLARVPADEIVQGSGGLTARELRDAIRRVEAAAA